MIESKITLLSALSYIYQSLIITLKIIFSLFFPIILSCIILNVLARQQNKKLISIGGWNALFITSWVGTPVHELSHFLAAVITNHKIIDLQLFKPDKRTGTMGYLVHSYQEDNFYQAVIGNTLIAIAPFFGGAAIIYLISTFIFPNFSLFAAGVPKIHFFTFDKAADWNEMSTVLNSHLRFFVYLTQKIFSIDMFSNWRLYAFLFIMFGIANHLSPSASDFQNFWHPVLMLLASSVLLSLVIFPLLKQHDAIISFASRYIYVFIPILYLAIFISLLGLILTILIYSITKLF